MGRNGSDGDPDHRDESLVADSKPDHVDHRQRLRDRFMRDNLDALARKVGEMQAKLMQLESLGERGSGLAGVNPAEVKARPGQGGALVAGRPLTMEELQTTLADLGRLTDQRTDLLTVLEANALRQPELL